ncbi:MAG: Asp-tRNA(Asn)/Glu-tRNA(Gln) amidotransferase subunit GatB [Candidatus Woesearchaeota archaeon]
MKNNKELFNKETIFDKNIIIGLEIHVELNTETKLFCSCSRKPINLNENNTEKLNQPNTRTCEICLGMPGSKPKVNKKAIEYALKIAKALNCNIADDVIFSRKTYFYPDMAKNFQITQYENPIGQNGFINLNLKDKNNINNYYIKKIRIKRVHLEEDPASLIHPAGIDKSNYVLIDYNRSGNPLVEIVTEPDINSSEEARLFLKKLSTILDYLNVYDKTCIMKADANISIKESVYVRTEIKNINGFKDIQDALDYEILRQKHEIKEGKKLFQETRAYDSENKITFSLRKKETEEDYGYIFEPDLVPIETKLFKIELPELPDEKIETYTKKYNLPYEDAEIIANEKKLAELFEKTIDEKNTEKINQKINPELAAKWIRREIIRVLNYNKIEISDLNINENEFIKLLYFLQSNKITEKTAQKIIEILAIKEIDVEKYIKENNLEVLKDSNLVDNFCKEAINENPNAVNDFKKGKQEALNFLLGGVMKKAKGKVDAKEVREKLIAMLND